MDNDPPKDSRQPTDAEHRVLQSWVRSFLAREAQATAGDPGPIVLRRLTNNEEYNYTIRDLTGIDSLNPTAANSLWITPAGEGFIDAGSPAVDVPVLCNEIPGRSQGGCIARRAARRWNPLLAPYDSARSNPMNCWLAFNPSNRKFTRDGGGTAVDLQGIKIQYQPRGFAAAGSVSHRHAGTA